MRTAHRMYLALRRPLLIVTLTSLLVACGLDGADGGKGVDGASGANGAPGANGSSAMLAVTAESAGLNCSNGGSRIDSGLDANRNGQLDASEITSTQYVCSAGSAVTSLVETRDEAAGSNCPSGGKRFTAGLDANGNGVLDTSEINSSGYICNGEQGSAGARALTVVVPESAGGNCSSGGVKINSGSDANGNGTLDVAETTGTQYVCNGANGAPGANGLSALLAVTAESPGLNCLNGGSRVDSGLDADRNGRLDASEITSTQYVCSAGSAVTSLVETHDEAAGLNCPSGGKRFTAGLDANRNGVLDASEINSSGYICDGAQGGAGARALTAVVPESAGANCASGGVKISSGSDANGNGTLDVAEITGTQYVCNGASATNTLIRSDIEAAGSNCTYGGTRISAGPDTNDNATLEPGEVTASAYACNGAPGPGVTWEDVTGTSVQALGNRGYVADNYTAEVVVTLPAAPAFGDLIQVYGLGAGGWRIAQNASQFVVTPRLYSEVGTVWTARESSRDWIAVASSSDGQKLVAATFGNQLYTSTDAGVTWTPRESARDWVAVASSADGRRLVAAVSDGQLYTSSDAGVSWTARESNRFWNAVASSSDGQRLVAAVGSGQLYTSSDAGVTWTARESNTVWYAVASSSDGERLVAATLGGQLYTSSDAGVNWTARESNRLWRAVASSSDGQRLVAAVGSGQLYTSSDAGVSWTARESNRPWRAVASSADGQRLVAAANNGGQLYTSAPAPRESTTAGAAGSISGRQYEAITLQYMSANRFVVVDFTGDLIVK